MSALLRPPASGPFAVSPRAAPRPRTLLLLVAGVILAHLLVLRTTPTRFGPRLDPAARRAPVFATRSIEPAPRPEAGATPAAPPTPKPLAKPAKIPISRKNSPLAQQAPAPEAIDLIAPTESEPAPAEALASGEAAMPAATDSVPATSAEAAADAAPAPAPAASAETAGMLPALPPGPRQTVVTAVKLPDSARLDYTVTGGARGLNYHARAELNWQNTGSSYEARMTVSALFIGSRSMTSKGQIISEGLAPGRFADKYKSEVAAHFEPDKGQVSFSANTPTVPWIKGMQDRVSVFFQLAGMLAAKPEGFPVGSTISMVTVGPRDADGWTFIVESAEMLVLPFGEMNTLKLSRQPRKQFDQKVEIWYAPSLGYLPVRSKITQSNGDFVDQQLTAVGKPSQ